MSARFKVADEAVQRLVRTLSDVIVMPEKSAIRIGLDRAEVEDRVQHEHGGPSIYDTSTRPIR